MPSEQMSGHQNELWGASLKEMGNMYHTRDLVGFSW